MRKRHPDNPNLRLHHEPEWQGLPTLAKSSGPMVENYLESIRSTLDKAVNQYPRTAVFHVIARLPRGYSGTLEGLPERFIASLREQIQADLKRKGRTGKRVHDCHARMLWCREQKSSPRPHYHIAVLVNRDAYASLGRIQGRPDMDTPWWLVEEEGAVNMAHRIQRAWESAIGFDPGTGHGLVGFPPRPVQLVNANQSDFGEQYAAVFRRLSYLAKAETKVYGHRGRNFGYSRD